MLIGRETEIQILNEALNSNNAEFIVSYGRRRVGKTYLIEQTYQKKGVTYFNATGIQRAPMKDQLLEFTNSLQSTFYPDFNIMTPSSWLEAFFTLHKAIEKTPKNKKVIIFLDEFPWLCSRKSKLLQALDYYWNHHWRKDVRIKLIICGSSASWIINKIINNKGGLHNRFTRRIILKPFTLTETKAFFKASNIRLNQSELLNIYQFCGGIPFYFNHIQKGLSASQQIDQLCFRENGILYDEFEKLFDSLFENANSYKELIRYIAQHRNGVDIKSIQTVISPSQINPGGTLSKKLQNLEDAAFIKSFLPLGNKRQGKSYRIIDEYCYFYLKWIEPAKKSLTLDDDENNYWLNMINSPSYYNWRGYAFEALCYKHIGKIRRALYIPGGCEIGTWQYRPRKKDETGTQIDLLFIRPDGVITICEIKYTDEPFVIDKAYYENLQRKINIYKKQTRSKNQIHLALIAANGLKENAYSELIVDNWIDASELF